MESISVGCLHNVPVWKHTSHSAVHSLVTHKTAMSAHPSDPHTTFVEHLLKRYAVWIALGVIVCISAHLRFSRIGETAFWCDEYRYTYLADRPCTVDDYDRHGFTSYVRLYARTVSLVGLTIRHEATFRFLNAALGVFSIVIIYLVGRRIDGSLCGVVAAMLLACNPFAVEHSRIATQYGSLIFAAAWMLHAAVWVCQSRRWYAWTSLVLSSCFAWHVHVFASCYLIGIWGGLAVWNLCHMLHVGKTGRPIIVAYLISGFVLACLCLPEYMLFLRHSMADGSRLNFASATQTSWQLFSIDRAVCDMFSVSLILRWFYYTTALVGCVVLFCSHCQIPVTLLLTLCAAFVTMHSMRISLLSDIKTFPTRYLAFLLPIVVSLSAAGVSRLGAMTGRLSRKAGIVVTTILLVGLFLVCVGHYSYIRYRSSAYPLTEYKDVARLLSEFVMQGDVILGNYDMHMLERELPQFRSGFQKIQGSFDGTGLTVDDMRQHLRAHSRGVSVAVTPYMRWRNHPVAEYMDQHCILLPFSFPYSNVHVWDHSVEEDPTTGLDTLERELVRVALRVCRNRHQASRREAEFLMQSGETNMALAVVREFDSSYRFDPWYWAVAAQIDTKAHAAHMKRLASRLLSHVTGVDATSLLLPSVYERARMSRHASKSQSNHVATSAVVSNLVKNGMFLEGLANWSVWGSSYSNVAPLIIWTNIEGKTCVRLSNPDGKLVGLKQHLAITSGDVFRLSASVRSSGTNTNVRPLGLRIALYSPGYPEHDVVWMHEYHDWLERSVCFTNAYSGEAILFFHAGYGSISTTADVTDVRLQRYSVMESLGADSTDERRAVTVIVPTPPVQEHRSVLPDAQVTNGRYSLTIGPGSYVERHGITESPLFSGLASCDISAVVKPRLYFILTNSGSSHPCAIEFRSCNNVVLSNIAFCVELQSANVQNSYGLRFIGCTNVLIVDCDIFSFVGGTNNLYKAFVAVAGCSNVTVRSSRLVSINVGLSNSVFHSATHDADPTTFDSVAFVGHNIIGMEIGDIVVLDSTTNVETVPRAGRRIGNLRVVPTRIVRNGYTY